jgi:hypothetical protein
MKWMIRDPAIKTVRANNRAADYREDKYVLLGMPVKYSDFRSKEVRVIGKNRSTLGEEGSIQRAILNAARGDWHEPHLPSHSTSVLPISSVQL